VRRRERQRKKGEKIPRAHTTDVSAEASSLLGDGARRHIRLRGKEDVGPVGKVRNATVFFWSANSGTDGDFSVCDCFISVIREERKGSPVRAPRSQGLVTASSTSPRALACLIDDKKS